MAVNELNATPNALRLHIAIFGRRNSGKSSLINAISNQNTALVSDVAGTTTDPVYRPIEIHPLGPCVLIDTAGFDDEGELGLMRVEKTREVISKTDLAVMAVVAGQSDFSKELEWLAFLDEKKIPVLLTINKLDTVMTLPLGSGVHEAKPNERSAINLPQELEGLERVYISARENTNIEKFRQKLIELAPSEYELDSITAHLINKGDHVLLVAPQDIQAPKGRLILPQIQTIRDLLDHKAIVSIVTTDKLEESLMLYKNPPKLIITDSQVFKYVKDRCPKETLLTSFSVLMARYKGDIDEFVRGAAAIDSLSEKSSILILEACSHNPLDGDIGRIKIPAMLKKRFGENIKFTWKSGNDIPADVSSFDLVIHCGGCMLNRKNVISRIQRCKDQKIPVTNYGVFIAHMSGILSDVVY
ncbi:[FeFe] hydrogenase H-cluster maturation GTPase HydF [Proteocatella sphenisci]|uniref:[FeFe] hydrogenase H-cluster maturation GTPase HydF n=1 Tax=Proteocatella sphenisci TaxID=181070 RepID=UPI00048C59E8|nr:[FeFe] hydrogenase H-cluster maturation GTPase HydF [Proteocatella sphenisci]